ncbi:ATP-dependent metalloprotease FtsH [Orenia metallireducens]|jgi:ATP-dependent metalloprotease FtsH|uniref:ATP-dependent metalloprotease FtsH n=1 Tax=Orenia metallireducens TaxID=1413210 RepID=A0A285HVF1_9FIRM|nr:AAA family ATPase [Orenia metallireducens]SNY39647.1 ATP-dependent metalloprotease FtsH [Orenia metallireducens]
MAKDFGLGIGVAAIIFLAVNGINLFPMVLLGGLGYFLFNSLNKQALGDNFAISNKDDNKVPKVDFADIGGQDSAKNELLEALEFVKSKEEIKKLGIRPLKGLMLSGPPGTGKTLMAKAAANYIDSIFISTSGSEFIEMYAGVGAKRVRKLFKDARDKAKKADKNNAIIFIDEIDVLGGKRGSNSSHMEYDQTLNQLLVELDGISVDDQVNVLVVGATNRIDILDEALLRPGRFDRIVKVDLPDREGREHILKIHTHNKPLAEDVDLEQLAKETFRFSGAQLESLTNEAAIMAMREDAETINRNHFKEAIDKVMMGEKLNRRPNKEELKRVAYHEVGHALLGEIVNPKSVSNITITSRGRALGYVRHNPEDDYYLQTIDYLKNQIAVLVAGSLVEEEILGNRSTGASNDFEKAIEVTKQIIFSGMSKLGVVSKDSLPGKLLHETISEIIAGQEELVRREIKVNSEFIHQVVEILLEEESITGDDFRGLLSKNKESVA